MKGKKVRKTLLMGLSLVLVAVIAVAGTYAYLQDSTEDVINTFSPNEVNVSLEEGTGDKYNIVPGTEEKKDPKVTVSATLPTYVYVEVIDETQGVVTYDIADGWVSLGKDYPNVYYREVNGAEKEQEYDILAGNKVSYSAALTNEDMKNLTAPITLSFKAYAIQKEPFGDPILAYTGVNPTEVNTANDLTNAIAEGKSVKLTEDISANVTVPEGKSVVIDLNGKKLSNDSSNTADTITIANGATLTLVGNGTVENTAAGRAAIYNNGNVIVENGTFTTNSYYLFLQHGEMTINGGTFTTDDKNSSLIDNGYYGYSNNNERVGYVEGIGQSNPKLVINGGTFEGGLNTVKNDDGGILEINGGTFSNTTQVPLFNVHIATVNGGTFNTPSGGDRTSIYNRKYDDPQDKGELTINGGTFNADYILETDGDAGTIVINNGTFNNEIAIVNPSSSNTVNSCLTINGGTFKNRQ